MSTTTHFDLPLLTANQDQPEVTVNEAMVLIDTALFDAGGSISVKEVGNSPAGDASNVKALHIVGATVESLSNGVALITIDPSASSDTSSDVESLPAGGTTGQVLAKSSNADYAVGWSTVSGGGGAATYLNGNITPDTHPSAPSARDDEFEALALDSKWTVWNPGSLGLTTDLNNGSLNLQLAGTNTEYCGIYQPLPSGAAWTYRLKMSEYNYGSSGATAVSGMLLYESGSGKMLVAGILNNSSPSLWMAYYGSYAGGTPTYVGFSGFGLSPMPLTNQVQPMYFEVSLASGTLTFRASYTGAEGSFFTIGSLALTSAFTTAPDHIGITVLNSTGTLYASYDWFRDYTNGYTPATGNAVVSGSGLWSPDTPPASPDAMDDEFNGTSLDPKWSLFNGSGTGVSTAFANGAITISIPADGGAGTRVWRGISQPLPAGTWRFRVKVRSVVMGTTYNFLGFIIADSVSKHAFSYGIDWHSSYGEPCFFSGASSDYTGHATSDAQNAVGSALRPFGSDAVASHYLEVAYDGTNYTLGASFDGINFGTVLSTAASTVGVTSPNLIILGGESISTTGCSITADYFRRRA